MSQYWLMVGSGTPTVPTSFTADDMNTATPAMNNLNIFGTNGISTTASGSTITVVGADQVDTVTTTDASATTLSSVTLSGSAAVYQIEAHVVAYNSTDSLGAGYQLVNAVRTDGATAVLCGATDGIVNEEGAMSSAFADIVVTGNTFVVQVTGIAGKTINWKSNVRYVEVS